MKVRYKKSKIERHATRFNVHAMAEVLTGDDSAFIKELDVLINNEWKDMSQAFEDKDIVPDNYNESFAPPINEECKTRGFNP